VAVFYCTDALPGYAADNGHNEDGPAQKLFPDGHIMDILLKKLKNGIVYTLLTDHLVFSILNNHAPLLCGGQVLPRRSLLKAHRSAHTGRWNFGENWIII
jgi:hypothetical protein